MSKRITAEHGEAVTPPTDELATIENVREMLDAVESEAHSAAFALVYSDGATAHEEARSATLGVLVGLREMRRELDRLRAASTGGALS